jgi:Protein of unknown function (DUF1553)/Protein of unknown function (DUF1549)
MRDFRRARSIYRWARVLGWVAVSMTVSLVLVRARAGAADDPPEPTWTDEQRQHWSFIPPRRPEIPSVKRSDWVRNPIDAFILSELETFEVDPAPEADRRTLIRRLRFDLTGLPPSAEEVEAFEADSRPEAYERLVDRLLASPQFGERWARFWLDLARYAESDGFNADKTRPDAWRYRDWVIQAANDDMPYDQFVRLQLAGDEVAPGDSQAFLATGFNRHWPFEDNNKVPGLNRQLMLEDMTDTTGAVFLGLTIGCARCHNHKYDPISQKDYYRFQALFAASMAKDDFVLADPCAEAMHAAVEAEVESRADRVRLEVETIEYPYLLEQMKPKMDRLPEDVRKALETEPFERSVKQEKLLKTAVKDMSADMKKMRSKMSQQDLERSEDHTRVLRAIEKEQPSSLPTAFGVTDTGVAAPPVFLLVRGNYKSPGEEVPPGLLSVLSDRTKLDAPPALGSFTTGRRRALAEWITRPDHPLTARVMVNRLWQNHFGRGIVATPSDFGNQGLAPSHPKLLDWLATEFIAQGWSMKAMHRLMVTSATYRQSSMASADTIENDPENTLFSRMFRRRLEGEAVRDALLLVSGQLDTRMGGPSVFPDLPPGVKTQIRGAWDRSPSAADRNRRSIYVFVRRNLKYPLFDAFDAPDSNVTCPERNVSVNAPQALMLLNSDLVLEQARAVAGRVLAIVDDRNDPAQLIKQSYRLALSRKPDPQEIVRGVSFLESQAGLTSPLPTDSKNPDLPTPLPEGVDPSRGAALVDFCHVLLNLNEFVFVD